MGGHALGLLVITNGTATRELLECLHHYFTRKLKETTAKCFTRDTDLGSPRL